MDGLDAQYMLSILDSIVSKMGGGGGGFAQHLIIIACFISYKKWVLRENYLNNTHLPYNLDC